MADMTHDSRVGEPVHYVESEKTGDLYVSTCRSATIMAVPAYPVTSDAEGNIVHLAVPGEDGALMYERSIPYAHPGDGGPVEGTWHWSTDEQNEREESRG